MRTTLCDISGGSRSFVYEITEENERGAKSTNVLKMMALQIPDKKKVDKEMLGWRRRSKDQFGKTKQSKGEEWSGKMAWVGDDGLVQFVTRSKYALNVKRALRQEAKS